MIEWSIINKIKEQKQLGGIDISSLKPGDELAVRTRNNDYQIKILKGGKVAVRGGKYFPEETVVHFHGSTFGGSMIKVKWIGQGMRMEFLNGETIVTSPVIDATIIGQGWSYDMKWSVESVNDELRHPVADSAE